MTIGEQSAEASEAPKISLTVYTGGDQVGRRNGLFAEVGPDSTIRDALDVVYAAARGIQASRRRAATLDAQRNDRGLVVYPIQRIGESYQRGLPVPLTTQLSALGTAEVLLVRPHGGGYGRH